MTTTDATTTAAPRSGHPARGAAAGGALGRGGGLWAGAAGLACTAATLAIIVLLTTGTWHLPAGPQVLVDATAGLTTPAIAVVIMLGRRTAPGTRTLALVLLASGTASAFAALTTSVSLAAPGPGPVVDLMVQLQGWLWVPGFLPLLTLVPLLYPDGLPEGRVWRVVASAAVVGTTLFAAGVALHPEALEGTVALDKPLTNAAAAQVLAPAGVVLLLPAALASMTALVLRLRRSTDLARRQVVVLLVAAAVLLTVTVLQGAIGSPADVIAQAGAVALLPLAIGVAVTRHRLYDLDTALCRGLVAASLAVCLAGLYLSILALLRPLGGQSAVTAAIAAGLTGAVLQPLGRRLSKGVDRLYYGDRQDPYRVTTRVSSRLAAPGLDIADVPKVVCDSVVSSLRLGGAEVQVLVDGAERNVARVGDTSAVVERFALRHRGETAGWLLVAPRPGELSVTAQDHDLLSGIADIVAPSIAALRLHHELQRGREQLVQAREAERLRLRRDLHDGLGATLAGLRLQLESAQALVAEPVASGLLGAAGDSVQHAVAEVRTISDGLRPPGIDDLGLGGALEVLAERAQRPGLAVEVRVDELGVVDPATEVAAYRIASEALTNAVRHARANQVTLCVSATDEVVRLVVTDDGVGHRAASTEAGSGLGLASMRRRAEEIGGQLTVGTCSSGQGTEVQAVLPRGAEVVP